MTLCSPMRTRTRVISATGRFLAGCWSGRRCRRTDPPHTQDAGQDVQPSHDPVDLSQPFVVGGENRPQEDHSEETADLSAGVEAARGDPRFVGLGRVQHDANERGRTEGTSDAQEMRPSSRSRAEDRIPQVANTAAPAARNTVPIDTGRRGP